MGEVTLEVRENTYGPAASPSRRLNYYRDGAWFATIVGPHSNNPFWRATINRTGAREQRFGTLWSAQKYVEDRALS